MGTKYNRRNTIIAILVLIIAITGLFLVNYPFGNKHNMNLDSFIKADRSQPLNFKTEDGWFDGDKVSYYNLGEASDNFGKLYVLIHGFDAKGNPQLVSGQKEIFSSQKGDNNYSDFWELVYVTVPSKYEADSIRSESELKKQNWTFSKTGKIIDQPQVFINDKITPEKNKVASWYNNRLVYSWQFNKNLKANPNSSKKVDTQNLFIMATKDKKSKTLVEITDQKRIFDTAPDEDTYSPLRQVIVVEAPKDYKPNEFKSVDDILNSNYPIYATDIYLNSPIVE